MIQNVNIQKSRVERNGLGENATVLYSQCDKQNEI